MSAYFFMHHQSLIVQIVKTNALNKLNKNMYNVNIRILRDAECCFVLLSRLKQRLEYFMPQFKVKY